MTTDAPEQNDRAPDRPLSRRRALLTTGGILPLVVCGASPSARARGGSDTPPPEEQGPLNPVLPDVREQFRARLAISTLPITIRLLSLSLDPASISFLFVNRSSFPCEVSAISLKIACVGSLTLVGPDREEWMIPKADVLRRGAQAWFLDSIDVAPDSLIEQTVPIPGPPHPKRLNGGVYEYPSALGFVMNGYVRLRSPDTDRDGEGFLLSEAGTLCVNG